MRSHVLCDLWGPVLATVLVAVLVPGCLLSNINSDDCESDGECEAAFGLGSVCGEAGYCGEPASCASSVTCRGRFGFGASCSAGRCLVAERDARCTLSEPEGLVAELPGILGDRVLLGAMFAFEQEEKFRVRADATRLAVREINNIAQGINGRELGILICNGNAAGDEAADPAETVELTRYLAGTLALPVIIGPTASSLSVAATNTLLEEDLATVLISPSATSNQLSEQDDRLGPDDPYGLFWRTCPSDALQGKVLARVIAGTQAGVTVPPDLDAVAVIYQNDTYGNGLQLGFRVEFQAIEPGHTVDGFSFEDGDDASIASAVANAAATGPQAILVIAGDAGPAVRVVEDAAPILSALPFFFADGAKDAAALLASSNSQAVKDIVLTALGTSAAAPSGPLYDTFSDALLNQFGEDASQFSFIANSYDAAYVGAYGMVRGLSASSSYDGRQVAEGLASLSAGAAVAVGPTEFHLAVDALSEPGGTVDISGTSGPLDFDATVGEAPGDIEIWSVRDPATVASCPSAPVPGASFVFVTEAVVPAAQL